VQPNSAFYRQPTSGDLETCSLMPNKIGSSDEGIESFGVILVCKLPTIMQLSSMVYCLRRCRGALLYVLSRE